MLSTTEIVFIQVLFDKLGLNHEGSIGFHTLKLTFPRVGEPHDGKMVIHYAENELSPQSHLS